jgi:hypothetical protein
MYQIVRLEVDCKGHVTGRQLLRPPYDLWEDAMALAEFDASRCEGDYGYDAEKACRKGLLVGTREWPALPLCGRTVMTPTETTAIAIRVLFRPPRSDLSGVPDNPSREGRA